MRAFRVLRFLFFYLKRTPIKENRMAGEGLRRSVRSGKVVLTLRVGVIFLGRLVFPRERTWPTLKARGSTKKNLVPLPVEG